MLKDIGRLETSTLKEIDANLEEIFDLLDKGTKQSKAKAVKLLNGYAKSPNYFIREYMGKAMVKYKNIELMSEICDDMLKHKFYGIRATGLFYYYNLYSNDPVKILDIVGKTFESVPWEVESIINDMWKRFPKVMKERMLVWLESESEKQRALSFHGMENIAHRDPLYIMDFINKAIDDESMEVQKKITHILTQVARSRPADCYPFIHEWLTNANERRLKTLWVSMKKLANIVIQKSKRDKTQEFIMLTQRTIQDWKSDSNKNVSSMGQRLYHIIRNK